MRLSEIDNTKQNPNELKRFNQCLNCRNLNICKEDDCEDENGMCRKHIPLGS